VPVEGHGARGGVASRGRTERGSRRGQRSGGRPPVDMPGPARRVARRAVWRV